VSLGNWRARTNRSQPSRPKSAAAVIAYLPNVVKATVSEAGVGVGGFKGSGEHGGVTLPDRQGVFSRRSAR